MKYNNLLLTFIGLILISSCTNNDHQKTILEKVDEASTLFLKNAKNYDLIVSIDHHRFAKDVGVYTPPSIATIFSDLKINSLLISQKQLVGLDLPFKVLCYAEPDTSGVSVAFTSASFIQKRHNLDSALMMNYTSAMDQVISSFPQEMISTTDISSVDEGFGIVSIKSDFDFSTTIQNLRDIVMAQGDTKWFADIDFQKDAETLGITISPTTLLLFGGPAPGGKAMMTSPKIGLDAFCQKLLVYQTVTGEVWIAYNDIVAFANLYYQTSTKPQQMINQRLKMTFNKAITLQEEK